MRVISLKFLSKHKHFEKGQKILFSSDNEHNIGSLTFSVLVGRNGSGKTTIMSFIAQIFHNIERYSNKYSAEFELKYEIEHELSTEIVVLKFFNKVMYITVGDKINSVQIAPTKNTRYLDLFYIDTSKRYFQYIDIKKYLPSNLVTSTFSMHGEYPVKRPYNYAGDQLICDHSISHIYGKNHYEIGSITKGIYRLIKLIFSREENILNLFNLFELNFNFKVLVYEHPFEEKKWIKVDKAWVDDYESRVLDDSIYLNDLEFVRFNRTIQLSNMSSGEKMLLLRSISILNSIEENSIVIIEEPELHLDHVWNRQLISLFTALYSNYRAHILIATHVHSLINTVPKSNLIFLENGQRQDLHKNTFLASYEELFSSLYGEMFKPNKVEEDYLNSISEKDTEELKADYCVLGNSIYKYLVFREIKKRGS